MVSTDTAPPISFSQIALFKRCAHRYFWMKEAGVRRRFSKPYTVLGDYIHQLLAAHAKGEPWQRVWEDIRTKDLERVLFEEEEVTALALAEQAATIVERYIRQVWNPFFSQWTVVEVETEHTVALPTGTPVVFKPDLLMRDLDGRLWLIDHKTMKDFPKNLETRLLYDDQITLYLYGLAALGMEPFGAIHDCIRTRLPRPPKLTTKGVLSRAACTTDAETVLKTVAEYRDQGVSIPEADVTGYLAEMPMSTFFVQVTTDRQDEMVNQMAQEYAYTGLQIRQCRDAEFWPRTFTRTCIDCPVRELCVAGLTGGDTETLLATTFTQRGEQANEERHLPSEMFGEEEEGSEMP